LHCREVERRKAIPVERREDSGGVIIQHRELFGLGRRSLGNVSNADAQSLSVVFSRACISSGQMR
jgi:hypothetical protein